MDKLIKTIVKTKFFIGFQQWLNTQRRWYRRNHWPNLRRVTPISTRFGFDRGLPIDRYYIEQFLLTYNLDIRGRALEFGEHFYTQKFGGGRVTKSDVLNVVEGDYPKTTIIADLTCADHIPSNIFDCIICTQTLQAIYNVQAAIAHLYRILKPGGVILATFHGTTKIFRREEIDSWGKYWNFTTQSAKRLFLEAFPLENISVRSYGNVLTAIAFLHGLATQELRNKELDYYNPNYEVLVAVRAMKPGAQFNIPQVEKTKCTGSITAHPNPIRVSKKRVGRTTLSWRTKGTERVEVHVGAPNGPLLSQSGPSGSVTTSKDKWVYDGMAFYLQDVSGGLPLTSANTLAVVIVRIEKIVKEL